MGDVTTPLKQAAKRLWHHYFDGVGGPHPWLACIVTREAGPEGEPAEIVLFLIKKPWRHDAIPEQWEGYPVRTKLTGPFTLC